MCRGRPELIRRFQPTKVAVEVTPDVQGRLDERYAQYLSGEYELGSNEVFQLGFRIAGMLGHERVYCIDTDGRRFEDVPNRGEYARANGMAHLLDDPFDPAFGALYAADDRRKLDWTLREHLLYNVVLVPTTRETLPWPLDTITQDNVVGPVSSE